MVVVRDSPLVVEAGGLFLCPARSTTPLPIRPDDEVLAAEWVALGAVIFVPVGVVLPFRVLAGGDLLKVSGVYALTVRAARSTVARPGLDSLGVAEVIDLVSVGEVTVMYPVGVLVGEPSRLPWSWPVVGVPVGCLGVSLE